MNKFLKLFFFLQFTIFSGLAGIYHSKEDHDIFTKKCFNDFTLRNEVKPGFLKAFTKYYKSIPSDILQIDNLSDFLENTFQEEIDDFEKPGIYQILLKDDQDKIMGYFSFDHLDQRKEISSKLNSEFKDFPPQSAYIRYLYVVPTYQRKGIAATMLDKILYEYFPTVEHIYVATCKFNHAAKSLYEHTGFKEISLKLHGLSEEKYTSYKK